ncbi:MAG: hypothetical protein Fur0012_09620 [Elusimicrobiota bacterium]
MIKKWELQHNPTSRDPLRHKLSLNCEMKDVFFLMKKLGSACSRPEKETGDYTYSVYILKADQAILEKARQAVEGMLDKTAAVPSIPKEKPVSEPEPEKVAPPSIPETETEKKPAGPVQETIRTEPVKQTPALEPEIIRPQPENKPSQPVKPQAPEPKKPQQETKPQAPRPPVAPAPNFSSLPEIDLEAIASPSSQQPEKAVKQDIPAPTAKPAPAPLPQPPKPNLPENQDPSKTRSPMPGHAIPPSTSLRMKKEGAKKEEEKAVKQEPKKEIPKDVSMRIKSKWPIELPLNPTLSFQTLIAGPHNRFAHAAAMAVVENPGVMYNPLLIFGPQGIGKSHFIHAIGYGLSSSIGQKNIFVTHAVKFSRGIDMAIEQKTIESLEKMLSEIKVFIIDDIDLFMITESNRPYISRILNDCVAANKQIIVSSMFPPKSLAPLEENLGFQFTQGWMVDIKLPNAQTYRMILNQMLSAIDIKISEDDIKTLFVSKMADFRTVSKILSYSKKMEKYMSALDPSLIHKDFISMLMGLSGDDETFPTDEEAAAAPASLSVKDQWFKWGVFYPRGLKNHANYAMANLKAYASSELKIDISWEQVFTEEYDPDEIYGIPFKIGEIATSNKVNGVIIVGPQSTSALGGKEGEFKTLTEKILESFSIKAAWLDSSKLKARGNYLRALMELI